VTQERSGEDGNSKKKMLESAEEFENKSTEGSSTLQEAVPPPNPRFFLVI
jgi:hypothetical protein